MADQTIILRGRAGDPLPLLLHDNGDGTYSVTIGGTINNVLKATASAAATITGTLYGVQE